MRSICCLLVSTVMLIWIARSITFNLNDSQSEATVIILRKSKPSVVIFPRNETIVINLPKKRFWQIDTTNYNSIITFGTQKQAESVKPDDANKDMTSKNFLLIGKFKVPKDDNSNEAHPNPIRLNKTHISYKICSLNECEYWHDGKYFQVKKCVLVERKQCKPFSDLYYQDLQFVIHLQLIKTVRLEKNILKFHDQAATLRLQLQKISDY